MESVAAVLFAAAALGGVFLAYKHFRGEPLPVPVAVVHGAAAAIALVILLIAVITKDLGNKATIALALLVVAALAGFFLVSFHLRGARHPSPAILAHALIAVIGFLTLLTVVF
ncbi:MAG: hypothetical protein ACR2OU_00855 [Thermomicrobiales bacterium]